MYVATHPGVNVVLISYIYVKILSSCQQSNNCDDDDNRGLSEFMTHGSFSAEDRCKYVVTQFVLVHFVCVRTHVYLCILVYTCACVSYIGHLIEKF